MISNRERIERLKEKRKYRILNLYFDKKMSIEKIALEFEQSVRWVIERLVEYGEPVRVKGRHDSVVLKTEEEIDAFVTEMMSRNINEKQPELKNMVTKHLNGNLNDFRPENIVLVSKKNKGKAKLIETLTNRIKELEKGTNETSDKDILLDQYEELITRQKNEISRLRMYLRLI
jgi:hypothetical protein